MGQVVLSAALLSGCAARQTPQPAPEPAPAPAARQTEEPQESPRDACLRRRAGIQECLVEAAMESCRGPVADMAVCMREALEQPLEFPGAQRDLSVIVNGGDEVLSLNLGEFVLISIVKLEASAVDENGVSFRYSHSQSESDRLQDMRELASFEFRVNFDGTTSGDIMRMNGLEIWNFQVSQAAGGAQISFSTTDNRITVRQ